MTSATAARIVFAAGLAALVLTGCKTLTGNLPTEAELAEMARKMPGETAIRERFEHEIDAIVDAGACPLEPTTVIDLTPMRLGNPPVCVREGAGPLSAIGL